MTRVTFLHPDLGIGGAERLIVDAALSLKEQGYDVNIVTNHYDSEHCFAETKNGTVPITVVGSWLPRHILGRFFALFACIRMIYAASYILFCKNRPDIVFCDQVSACIPILRLRIPHIIFYCHYPDLLLSPPGGLCKQFYRLFLDYLEEITTGMAHKVLVNSLHTADIFKFTFKRLNIEPEVLYPSINTDYFDNAPIKPLEKVLDEKLPPNSTILLSINRYERKKFLKLAIEALSKLQKYVTEKEYKNVYLIMAGGYDKRVEENVECYLELIGFADELNVTEKVIFLRSPSDIDKISLLYHCMVVLYTPVNEHFGIVPLEAMYMSKPVIAHNSGGPQESVVSGITGFLVNLSGDAFARKIAALMKRPEYIQQFGNAGRIRFMETFNHDVFNARLNKIINDLINKVK